MDRHVRNKSWTTCSVESTVLPHCCAPDFIPKTDVHLYRHWDGMHSFEVDIHRNMRCSDSSQSNRHVTSHCGSCRVRT
jgi:hypothetical protein